MPYMNYILEPEELEECRKELEDIDKNIKTIKKIYQEKFSDKEIVQTNIQEEMIRKKHLDRINNLDPFLKSLYDPSYL